MCAKSVWCDNLQEHHIHRSLLFTQKSIGKHPHMTDHVLSNDRALMILHIFLRFIWMVKTLITMQAYLRLLSAVVWMKKNMYKNQTHFVTELINIQLKGKGTLHISSVLFCTLNVLRINMCTAQAWLNEALWGKIDLSYKQKYEPRSTFYIYSL